MTGERDIRLVRWPARDRHRIEALIEAGEGADTIAAIGALPELPSYAERAEALAAQQRRRAAAFGETGTMFRNPMWDIILNLFIAEEQGRPLSASSAAQSNGLPLTSGLRWLRVLEARGLVTSWPDARDQRVRYIGLTPSAMESTLRYLDCV